MALAAKSAVDEDVMQDTSEAQEDGKRERSSILFPYQTLDDAIAIAKAIHELHGSSCQYDQIAAHLKQSPNSSGFRIQVGSAKTFGLVTTGQGTVTLTTLGTKICDPQQERAARVEAFLAVPLYNAVYEKFKGNALPPTTGLEAAVVSMGVAQKQKERARQVLQRSAQQAGFFQFGNDRLVLPAFKASAAPIVNPPEPEEPEKKKTKDEDDEELHPFIRGLLKKLPAPDSEWPMDGRAKWLQTAANIFDLMYTDSDDSRRSINIGFTKNSANQ